MVKDVWAEKVGREIQGSNVYLLVIFLLSPTQNTGVSRMEELTPKPRQHGKSSDFSTSGLTLPIINLNYSFIPF